MNKIDRFDALKLTDARKLIQEVYEYNYMSESDGLTKKLATILNKIDKIFSTELEPTLQEEYNLLKEVK